MKTLSGIHVNTYNCRMTNYLLKNFCYEWKILRFYAVIASIRVWDSRFLYSRQFYSYCSSKLEIEKKKKTITTFFFVAFLDECVSLITATHDNTSNYRSSLFFIVWKSFRLSVQQESSSAFVHSCSFLVWRGYTPDILLCRNGEEEGTSHGQSPQWKNIDAKVSSKSVNWQ